jgi:hypothetical protein
MLFPKTSVCTAVTVQGRQLNVFVLRLNLMATKSTGDLLLLATALRLLMCADGIWARGCGQELWGRWGQGVEHLSSTARCERWRDRHQAGVVPYIQSTYLTTAARSPVGKEVPALCAQRLNASWTQPPGISTTSAQHLDRNTDGPTASLPLLCRCRCVGLWRGLNLRVDNRRFGRNKTRLRSCLKSNTDNWSSASLCPV